MDLLSESSSGARVLTARHISAEIAFPETNDATNTTTLLCHSYSLEPDFRSYFAGLDVYAWSLLWSGSFLLFAATCAFYVVTMRAALRHWGECIKHVAVVVGIYPVISAIIFIAIILPRARIFVDALAHELVMITIYNFFLFIIMESGGYEEIIRSTAEIRIETNIPPCCCCCKIARPKIRKLSLEWLRYLALQLPLIQGLILSITLILWSEDTAFYNQGSMYLEPFILASILTGMWGMTMCVGVVEALGHNVKTRFLMLKLTLMAVKIQPAIVRLLTDYIPFPCFVSMHPTLFVNTLNYVVLLIELLLLSVWGWRLYRNPPEKLTEKVQQVVVAVMEAGNLTKNDRYGVINNSFDKDNM